MFTGIIQTVGKVKEIGGGRLIIEAPEVTPKLKLGSSIACDGACLTATEIEGDTFSADYMKETAAKTIWGIKQVGDLVNLELPMGPEDLFEGHIVTGHVEGMGEVLAIEEGDAQRTVKVSLPNQLAKYVVAKGSITINGISLTVIEVGQDFFTVGIIPHTWEHTNLKVLEMGSKVNLETDLVAKHLEKLMQKG